jgi:precorrin-6A/cobalt-precorrin-6A reductase
MSMRLLILGGATEASALAAAVAEREDIEAILSLAGRTRPAPAPIPMRVGGFGGVAGLRAYLEATRIDVVIDATHPFAAQMSRHAAEACATAKIPLLAFTRPPWRGEAGDRWIEVDTMAEAVDALGSAPRNVFLTQGRQQLGGFAAAPQHRYLVRAIERPDTIDALPHHRLILARGPFKLHDEEALMREERIELVVAKNSGGEATYAKIEAARNLALPVVIVRRPAKPAVAEVERLAEVLDWIDAHRGAP